MVVEMLQLCVDVGAVIAEEKLDQIFLAKK